VNDPLKSRIPEVPTEPGVYLMKDAADRVIYVGKAKDLRARLRSWFSSPGDDPKVAVMLSAVKSFEWITADSEVDALLMEARLIKDIQPRYNIELKDDKSYPYLEITRYEDFPRVAITRNPRPRSKLYGPFTSAKDLRAALAVLQRIFKFRTCNLDIGESDTKRRFFRPCLLHFIKRCTAPCADRITKDDYRRSIRSFRDLLEGGKSALLKRLQREMRKAAEERRFERAAELRDQITALGAMAKRGVYGEFFSADYLGADFSKALEQLGRILNMPKPPRTIEGVDIANLGAAEAVGSLVTFIDGKPFKNGYRRFKIKRSRGIDDYAKIREVVHRRLRHLVEDESPLPDVLLVDGGRGQLSSALAACKSVGVRPERVISIAKREDVIYTPESPEPIRLARNNSALRLLQYVRDEAHRFAVHYHHLLRSKDLAGGAADPKRKRKARDKHE